MNLDQPTITLIIGGLANFIVMVKFMVSLEHRLTKIETTIERLGVKSHGNN